MNLKHIRTKTVGLLTVVSIAALCLTGCESKNLKACQDENMILSQQVAELEYQLSQADRAAALNPTTGIAVPVSEATYLVVQGDTLWSIAQRQLGDGKRFKEILALNPQITKGGPLVIGTTLKMPPR